MFLSFADQSIEVIRPGVVTDHGRERRIDLEHPEAVEVVEGCSVQPGDTRELTEHRQTTLVQWTVYAPPGTRIEATDVVRVPGDPDPYQVDGEPARWPSPTGGLDHVVIGLEKWKEEG